MFTISFNSAEKAKLIEILANNNSKEAKEFIYRINNSTGFYSPLEQNDIFRHYNNGGFENKIFKGILTPPKEKGGLSGYSYLSGNPPKEYNS